MKLTLLILVFAIPSLATDRYFSGSGSGSTCSLGSPCTFATAYGASNAGDVAIMVGNHTGSVSLNRAGSAGSGYITLRGYDTGSSCPTTAVSDINHPTGTRPNPTYTLTGTINIAADYNRVECIRVSTTADALEIDTNSINNIRIVDSYVSRSDAGGGTGVYLGDNVAYATAPSDIQVTGSYITKFGYGFLMHCNNCLFENNEVFDLRAGSSGADGDYSRVMGDGITFRHNYFHGNDINNCAGCHVDCWQTFNISGTDISKNVTLDGNVCFNSHEGVIATNTAAGANHDNWTIKNNLIAYGPNDSHPWCILLDRIWNAYVYNNTCIGGGTRHAEGGNMLFKNNIYVDGGGTPYGVTNSSTMTGNNNLLYESGRTYLSGDYPNDVLNQNPLFVASGSDNYQLQSGSPAKDVAANVGVTTDLKNVSRPQGAGYDIGAYEFVSGSSAPTVTTTAASSVTTTTASAGGNVTSDGGASVTSRGTCYATSSNPTTPCTSDGTGTGSFTSSLTGLSASTLYHIRAFATNSVGTSYGSDLTFTTSAAATPVSRMSGKGIISGKTVIK